MTARRFRRPWAAVATLAILGSLLGACGSGSDDDPSDAVKPPSGDSAWDDLVKEAQKEGRVTLYTALTQPAVDRLEKAWDEVYPSIDLDVLVISTGQLLTRLDQELATNSAGADVTVHTDTGWFETKSDEDALVEFEGPSVEEWRQSDDYFHERYVIAQVLPWGVAFNTNQVTNGPKTFDDLGDAAYRGRVGVLGLASTTVLAWWDHLDSSSPGFMDRVQAQKPRFYDSNAAAAQAVVSGEVSVAAPVVPTTARQLIADGAPIKLEIPTPAPYSALSLGVLSKATHPAAAQVLADFLLSASGQEAINGDGQAVAPLGTVASAIDLDPSQLYNLQPETYDSAKVDEFTSRWDGIFR